MVQQRGSIILITLIVLASFSQACHLKSRCRKKRSFSRRGGWNIHGGCSASSKHGRLLDTRMPVEDIFKKYRLIDEAINNELSICVNKKMNPINAGKISYRGLDSRNMFRYYFVYLWAKDTEECKDHKSVCNIMRDCVISLLRAVLYS